MAGGRPYTQDEDEIITSRYVWDDLKKLSADLNRTRRALQNRACVLGISRNKVLVYNHKYQEKMKA